MIIHVPAAYRAVFMLRAVEGLNVAETAECLALSLETVKTRFAPGAIPVFRRIGFGG